MSKIIAMLITVSTLFLPSIIQAKPISIKVAYENNPGEPLDVVMRYWADLLNKKSNGEITLALYPSSQLGSKQDVTEQAMMGMNVITLSDVAFLADYEPDLGILFGPYLTDDPQKLFKIYESDWFKQKNESLKKKGIHVVMNNYLYGTRQIISKKPIRTVDDLAGLKIRVPNNVMQIKAIQAMGATPTPMPLGEVYPALTQGVIDGVENPISVLQGQKLYEQARYLTMVNYLTNTSVWIGGEAFFSTLSPEQLEMIHQTGYEAGVYSQKLTLERDAEMLKTMQAAGVEVIYPDTGPFQKKAREVYSQFPEWTPGHALTGGFMRLFGKVAEFSAAFALFVLVVMTIGAVFMRYFIGQPLQWTEEMSGMLMIWVVMLGGVVAERDRAHLTIPFLMEMLPGKLRRVIAVLVAVLSIALLLYMAWLGYRLAEMAQFKVTQILKVSWFWIDLAVPVGALATAIYTLYWLIHDIKQSDSGDKMQ
eukprot:gene12692-15514_t